MQRIDKEIWSYLPGDANRRRCRVYDVMASDGVRVDTFPRLVEIVAELGYANRRFNLFYRGQGGDHRVRSPTRAEGISSVLPAIFRPPPGRRTLRSDQLGRRFDELERFAELLRSTYVESELFGEWRRIGRYPELRWALLQHYQVCRTPLLDITQSLRVAASFATQGDGDGVLYVFGMPHVTHSISHHVDDDLTVVKLQSICPAVAKRAHYQEGFLVGPYPVERNRRGTNLGYRMLAKLTLPRAGFWSRSFPRIPDEALMPADDRLLAYFADLQERYLDEV